MAKTPGVPKVLMNVRMTVAAKEMLKRLADRAGISQAAWMETIIRREAKREKAE